MSSSDLKYRDYSCYPLVTTGFKKDVDGQSRIARQLGKASNSTTPRNFLEVINFNYTLVNRGVDTQCPVNRYAYTPCADCTDVYAHFPRNPCIQALHNQYAKIIFIQQAFNNNEDDDSPAHSMSSENALIQASMYPVRKDAINLVASFGIWQIILQKLYSLWEAAGSQDYRVSETLHVQAHKGDKERRAGPASMPKIKDANSVLLISDDLCVTPRCPRVVYFQ